MPTDHVVLGQFVNASIVRTTQGVVVIDTAATKEEAEEVYSEATRQGKVLFVINTHEHFDHLAGNSLFSCPIISSGRARKEMKKSPQLDTIALPTITFDKTLTLHLGERVEVTHFGGHCLGASVVYFPERRLLFVGDLVFNGRVPYIGVADFTTWIDALRELETWDADIVVPGHGPVGGKDILVAQRLWLETFVERVRALSATGLAHEDIFTALLNHYTVIPRWHPMLHSAISTILSKELSNIAYDFKL